MEKEVWSNALILRNTYRNEEAPAENKILSKTISIAYDCRVSGRNANTLILGCPGSGKGYHFIRSNITKSAGSFIILDPLGEYYNSYAGILKDRGYEVRALNFINGSNESCSYNPLAYIKDYTYRMELERMSDQLLRFTNNDMFFQAAAKGLLIAILYAVYTKEKPGNLKLVKDLIVKACKINEDGTTEADYYFKGLKVDTPAARFWREFSNNTVKIKKEIALLLNEAFLDIPDQLYDRLLEDTVDIRSAAYNQTAIFVCINPVETSCWPLIDLFFDQVYKTLFDEAGKQESMWLPVHTEIILDEFANLDISHQLSKTLALASIKNISFSLILQNVEQLKKVSTDWEAIIGNCDSIVHFGTFDPEEYKNLEYLFGVSKDLYNLNVQRQIFEDEALVLIRGEAPALDYKFYSKTDTD